jgi:ATP-dependent helicase/nuclease subunit A
VPDFTPHQLEAVLYRSQDACVVAGPGSGKTTVLVERYRRLVEEYDFDLRQILAITFTEKAAANMKAKLAHTFRHDDLRLRDLESAWVSTIHGFCARLLRENAIAAGIDPRFAVLDARESDDLQFECITEALDRLVAERRDDALALIGMLQEPKIAWDLKNAYDGIRSAGKSVEDVRAMPRPVGALDLAEAARGLRQLLAGWPPRIQLTEARRRQYDALHEWVGQALSPVHSFEATVRMIADCPLHLGKVPDSQRPPLRELKEAILPAVAAAAVDNHTARFRRILFDSLAGFDALYNQRKTERGALDFNDLERRAIELLRRNADVRERIRSQFRQIMLDEYQDINEQQAQLICLIRSPDVFFAVGDVNQSIYGFRHARPEIFHAYHKEILESRKHSAQLLHNFRSREEILRCVEALMNTAEGIQERALEAGSTFPEKTSPSIEVIRVLDQDPEAASDREARWIAHRITELIEELPARVGEFAVLCRNGESMRPILAAFDRCGIPYVCGRRQSFLLAREGLDITALLRTIANPRDEISLATVLRSMLVGISDEALLRVRLLANSLSSGLNVLAYDSARLDEFTADDRAGLQRFTADLKRWRADLHLVPLDVLMARMLDDCGFRWTPGAVTGDNIEAFLHLARAKGAQRSLLEFLHELESIEDAVSAESDLSDEDQGNRVQVMTAHAAKGLEFRVTIIAAMQKGTQRESAPVTFTPEHGLGIRWKDTLSAPGKGAEKKDGLKDSWAHANSNRIRQRDKEESNRLLYVAMTRAAEHLILTYTSTGKRPGNWAKRVDEFFGLADRLPAAQPAVLRQAVLPNAGFEVSVLVTDRDPPPPRVHALEERKAVPVPALLRPALQEQHDTAVNVTSLAVFASCPRKYYLQRYIGWNTGRFAGFDAENLPADDAGGDDDSGVGLDAAEMGSLVHELLAGKPGPHPPEAHRLANVFLESDLGRRAASASRAGREWDFIADIDDTLVRGAIDLWFEENGEIHVVDYKTDAIASPADYAPQLALYALAIESAFGKPPASAWLCFLRTNLVVEVPLDGESLPRARRLIGQLREAQNNLMFELRVGEQCKSCRFFKSLCPA